MDAAGPRDTEGRLGWQGLGGRAKRKLGWEDMCPFCLELQVTGGFSKHSGKLESGFHLQASTALSPFPHDPPLQPITLGQDILSLQPLSTPLELPFLEEDLRIGEVIGLYELRGWLCAAKARATHSGSPSGPPAVLPLTPSL